ncbi:hypothetical protein RXV86_03310 [Alisedimentitalea sp. MJ-SS2]|uniref:SecDF P1 head subdomain-containing protein n=1 Tax=Aliisedimentitalea sp. MJ-SS2 TaxID=3049795 RepID=UPI002907DFEA|nr:hypothetical protein [Alisedimentitalea sp. MJ-SS2]MDU8926405.1 hypothetical protein [Alisedimentitalea sp. MJ-SS2]
MFRVLATVSSVLFAAFAAQADECDGAFTLLAWTGQGSDYTEAEISDAGNFAGPALATATDVAAAELVTDYAGSPAVKVVLTEDAAERFAQATAGMIGKPMAIVARGRVLSAPIVQDRIAGGQMIVTGGFDRNEARALMATFDACGAEQEKQ